MTLINTLGNIQTVAYSKEYFDLQLKFANKVSEISGKDIDSLLLQYTSFFKTFRIDGWDFSPDNPIWQVFITAFNKKGDIDAIYNFYLQRIKIAGEKNAKELFGCFSYEYEQKDKSISIHFRNVDPPEPGSLSKERFDIRKGELTEMFGQIKKRLPNAKKVTGFSWLYNIEAYNRLFPPEYVRHGKIIADWFRSTALWGQFLDSSGNLKDNLVQQFLVAVSTSENINDLKNCFPYPVLKIKADIKYFYEFYKL